MLFGHWFPPHDTSLAGCNSDILTVGYSFWLFVFFLFFFSCVFFLFFFFFLFFWCVFFVVVFFFFFFGGGGGLERLILNRLKILKKDFKDFSGVKYKMARLLICLKYHILLVLLLYFIL